MHEDYAARLAQINPVYTPTYSLKEDAITVQIHPTVTATVETDLHQETSVTAYWARRVQHLIHIHPSPEATITQMRETLQAAAETALAQDRAFNQNEAANHHTTPGSTIGSEDRCILLTTPYLDKDLTSAAHQAGFRVNAMNAYQSLEKLQHYAHYVSAQMSHSPQRPDGKTSTTTTAQPRPNVLDNTPEVGQTRARISAAQPADEEAIAQAIAAVNQYDAPTLNPHPKRPNEDEITRSYARSALAAGKGWTSIARQEGSDEIALLTFDPPAQCDWARAGLRLENFSYLGFAYTPPTWRGQGIMSEMLVRAFDFLHTQGIENIGVGYSQHNPTSSRYWVRWGFIPAIAQWAMDVR